MNDSSTQLMHDNANGRFDLQPKESTPRIEVRDVFRSFKVVQLAETTYVQKYTMTAHADHTLVNVGSIATCSDVSPSLTDSSQCYQLTNLNAGYLGWRFTTSPTSDKWWRMNAWVKFVD